MPERLSDQLRRLIDACDAIRGEKYAFAYHDLEDYLVNNRDNITALIDAAQKLQRILDSIANDENDGEYRLHTDADLYNANIVLREALAAFGAGQDTNG